MTKEDIEKEMDCIQKALKQHTGVTKLLGPLPSVPSGPNIARTSDDMWKIYRYKRAQYDRLQSLPTEREFLTSLLGSDPDISRVRQRISDLREKERTDVPCVEIPLTNVPVLTWNEKVAKAKLIAQHIAAEQHVTDPEAIMNEVSRLQNRLMELEEAYLESSLTEHKKNPV